MTDDIKRFAYGTRLRHRLAVEVNDTPSDPTSLNVYLIDPVNSVTGPFTPTKDAQGYYEYQKTYTGNVASAVWGSWTIRWIGTGNAEGAAERTHFINTSRFP